MVAARHGEVLHRQGAGALAVDEHIGPVELGTRLDREVAEGLFQVDFQELLVVLVVDDDL